MLNLYFNIFEVNGNFFAASLSEFKKSEFKKRKVFQIEVLPIFKRTWLSFLVMGMTDKRDCLTNAIS